MSWLARRRLDEINKCAQGRGQEASAGIVEERSREARPPRFKDGLEHAAGEVRTQPVLEKTDDAGTGDGGFNREVGCPTDLHDERAGKIDPHNLAVAFELPRLRRLRGVSTFNCLLQKRIFLAGRRRYSASSTSANSVCVASERPCGRWGG